MSFHLTQKPFSRSRWPNGWVRYRDTINVGKRGSHEVERVVLNAFLLHPRCRRKLSDLAEVAHARRNKLIAPIISLAVESGTPDAKCSIPPRALRW
jgi:hypothetical protein